MSTISRRGILPNVGYKSPVVVVSTANITLSGSQVIGSVTVLQGNRVLANAQTDPTENGIYDVDTAGTWPRSQDFNDRDDVVNGVQVLDLDTSVVYRAVFTAPYIPGTTVINFNANPAAVGGVGATTELLFNLAGAIVSDPNLTWDGSDLDITGDITLTGTVDGVDVSAHASVFVAHAVDGTIHFTEGSIVHANIMGSGTNAHSAIDTHIADTSIHFLQGDFFTLVTETTTSRTAVAFEAVMVDDDTAGGAVTITLPASVADDQIIVKKLGTTANVIIDGDSAEEIDGATTFTLTVQYESLTLIADGTGWNII